MSKNQKASGITNIINYDNSGNISFVSGSTTLMSVSSSGAVLLTGTMSGGVATSASLSANSNLLQGTGSIGFATTASLLEVSSSQQQISASLLTLTASYTALSSSYTALSGSYNTFSGSASTRITVDSASLQQISASLLNVVANYATTGSNSFRANQSITGSLVVSSTITAQTLVVQTVTSSIVYSSGSNIFGSALSNTQTFTGSVNITGSLALAGNITSNGTAVMLGTGSANYLPKFTGTSTIGNSQIFDNGSFIGINTTSNVGYKVDIRSPTGDADINIQPTIGTNAAVLYLNNTGGGTYFGRENSAGGGLLAGSTAYATIMRSTGTNPIQFGVNNSVNFTIVNGGNVGIGTTNPFVVFDVRQPYAKTDTTRRDILYASNDSTPAGLRISITGGASPAVRTAHLQTTEWGVGNDGIISLQPFGGKVGIGVTNPTKLFEVNGRMATSATVSTNLIAGNIASNMPSSPAYIPIFNLAEAAGMSLVGFVNAASYTCFNISQIYIKKEYSGTGITAGITGLYKLSCDFSIVNITYSGVTYVALRFTSNPEIDVMWTGYLLNYAFNSDGSAQVWTSGVTLNSTYATY